MRRKVTNGAGKSGREIEAFSFYLEHDYSLEQQPVSKFIPWSCRYCAAMLRKASELSAADVTPNPKTPVQRSSRSRSTLSPDVLKRVQQSREAALARKKRKSVLAFLGNQYSSAVASPPPKSRRNEAAPKSTSLDATRRKKKASNTGWRPKEARSCGCKVCDCSHGVLHRSTRQ